MLLLEPEWSRMRGKTKVVATYSSVLPLRPLLPASFLNIDTSHRTLHGALLDALLTAQAVQKLWHHSVGLEERSEKNTVFVKKRNKK